MGSDNSAGYQCIQSARSPYNKTFQIAKIAKIPIFYYIEVKKTTSLVNSVGGHHPTGYMDLRVMDAFKKSVRNSADGM